MLQYKSLYSTLTFLSYTSEHLLYTWIILLQYIVGTSTGTSHHRDEINSRSSSILDHFPDIGRSNVERIQSKHGPIFLSYTSEHLLYTWIILLQYIVGASTGTSHHRDEINSRSSSILDHFPDIGPIFLLFEMK